MSRAREVSVGVQDVGGELIVITRFKIRSEPLEREAACADPPNCDPAKYGTRVKESARRRKEKEIAKLIESLEFPDVIDEINDEDIISSEPLQ